MVISFLKRILGGGGGKTPAVAPAAARAPAERVAPGGSEPPVTAFVEYVAKALVDQPESVQVSAMARGKDITLQIRCEKRDIGKIIGKNGKTIAAIRALTNGAAGRTGQHVSVEVLD
jgi:hypothetical protein